MFARLLSVVGLGVVASMVAVAPAQADPSPVISPIQAGATGTPVGTSTFTRTVNSDGTETLTVSLQVLGGMTGDQLCLSPTAFTSRVNKAQCPAQFDQHSFTPTATTDTFTMNVGTEYLGKTIYAQLHVNTNGQTGFAGWTSDGSGSFYGNVAVDSSPIPGAPTAPLLGSWAPFALAALFMLGGGFVLTWQRRRRASAS